MFKTDKIYAEILRISLPISLALVIPFLNLAINNYFFGRLGELELGTAGITGVYYLLFAMLGNGLASAVQTIIARRSGENNKQAIGITFTNGFFITLGFSVLYMFFSFLCTPLFLSWVLHDEKVQTLTTKYIYIRIWGLPFLYVFQLINAFLMGTGNTRFLMYGTIVQAGLNILLDYGFIFGKMGFPSLGFNGAAVASVFSEMAGMLVVLCILFKKKYVFQFFLWNSFQIHINSFKKIIKTSLPLKGQYAISLTSWLFFYLLIEHTGTQAMAISNLMRNLFSFTGIIIWAFASTTNTIVSNYIGQDKQDKVIEVVKNIAFLSFTFVFIFFIIINFFSASLLTYFGHDPSFIQSGIPVIRIVSCAILLQSISVIWLNAVTGTGRTSINLLIELLAIIFYGIYIYLVIEVLKWSLVWAWASEIIYWSVIFVCSYLFMKSYRWKNHTL